MLKKAINLYEEKVFDSPEAWNTWVSSTFPCSVQSETKKDQSTSFYEVKAWKVNVTSEFSSPVKLSYAVYGSDESVGQHQCYYLFPCTFVTGRQARCTLWLECDYALVRYEDGPSELHQFSVPQLSDGIELCSDGKDDFHLTEE